MLPSEKYSAIRGLCILDYWYDASCMQPHFFSRLLVASVARQYIPLQAL
jgi:hypothetical protein